MREFKDRVAVVTGAASGIGRALAERFVAEGMRLVIADIEPGRLAEVAEALRAGGAEVLAEPTDVGDAQAVERLAAAAYARFGAVHLLCNNAGVVPAGRARPIWEYPVEDWRWTLDVNLMGVAHGIRSFIPRMLAGGEPGHVVNTASVAGLISGAATPVYSVAKHGVVRATEALYASLREIGAPIGVTVLCPGVVRTRIFESERNRPAGLVPAGGIAPESPDVVAVNAAARPRGLAPETVTDMVMEAVTEDRLYLLTTDAYDVAIRVRAEAVLARRNPDFPDLLELVQREEEGRG
ncbi:MAG TPA: SDR family NAD(P)-dependent oxidoreductase [Paracoccaceae bacterium]|nr:SDR family NAD(P)-dependent oxidoreductase [Paracoccaceae bacterium]